MESNEPEEKCSNTKTGEETIALERRRSKSRRVSFAETTAIHLFIRDEEYETPPEVECSSNGRLDRSESDEIRDLLSSDSDDSDNVGGGDDDDDDGNAVKSSFINHIESPSPGSNFGSATSNDEENYFGPVSAEFIKPGRLLDSAASDENHDVTMDSTAFSMHFRSIAKSDLGGEFKTPTGVSLGFGERTSGQVSTTTSSGDPMVLTASRKRAAGSLPANAIIDSGNSDDMSVVGENLRKYDYGELPPDLNVLLAEDGKDMGAVSQISNAKYSNNIRSRKLDAGSGLQQNGLELLDLNNNNVDDHHVSNMKGATDGAFCAVHVNVDNKNDSVPYAALGGTTHNTSNMDDEQFPVVLSDDQTKTPVLLTNGMPVNMEKELGKGSVEASGKFRSSASSSQPILSHEQPIAGSVSSLLGNHRQTFRGSPNAKSNLFVAERKFSNKESKHIFSASSFEKGVSRLKKLELVSFASASKAEGNASRVTPPKSLNNSLTGISLSRYGGKDTSTNLLAAPVACLDTHFSKVAQDDGKLESKEKIGLYNLRRTSDAQYVIHTEIKDAEFFSLSAGSCHDKSTKFTGTNVSPLALSKDKSLEPCALRDSHTRETLLSTESDCSLLDITYNDSKYNRETRMPVNSTFSPETSAKRKVSASPLYQGSLSNNLNGQAEYSLRLDREVKQKTPDNFASRSESTGSLHSERKEEANWCTSDIEPSKIVIQEMQIDESMLKKLDKASESFKLVISNANADNGTMLATALPVKNTKSVAGSAATSEDNPNEMPTQVSGSPKEDLSCRLLQKKPCFTDNKNVHCSVGSTVLTPRSYQLTSKHEESNQCLMKASNLCGDDSSSILKRKLFDKADGHDDEFGSLQPKQKLCKDQKHCEGDSKVPHVIGGDASERDWVDVLTGFCGMSKLLTSSLIDKLDLAQIRMLKDIIAHLDKMRSYELLRRGICSQKSFDTANFLQVKRMGDTKLLLYRTVYQKLKLQLMHLERDKLLDHVHQLDFKVEESKMLISSCHGSYIRGLMDAKVDCFPTVNPSKTSSVVAEISSLWKELEVLDDQIRNLNKAFNAYIKVPKGLTCIETTVHVKNFLRKRVACRLVQSECQLCQVGSVKAMDGKPNILFDHGGIMAQRFIVKSMPTYGLFISNSLNTVKISKMFPALDACTAFSFASCGQSNIGYSGFWTIAQETQKTTSLLHSVLDVVEEVELAMLELRNLTNSRFLQPSAGMLDLQLCFTDFKSGATVSLSIDITSLNRGIYPSQVLPYEVQGRAASRQESFQSLLDNIKNAVRGVRCGYMRIISLCRCVSRTIQVNCKS